MRPAATPARPLRPGWRGIAPTAGAVVLLFCLGLGTSSVVTPRSGSPGRPGAGAREPAPDAGLDAALAQARRSLAAAEAAQGPDHPEVARALASVVHLMWEREEYAAAKPLAERALAIRMKALGGMHPDVASSLYQVGELRRATGDYAGAMQSLRRAIAIWETTLGPEDPEVASALHYLGVMTLTIGDPLRAKSFLERALAIREKSLGPAHELVATTLNALAGLLIETGDPAAAAPLLERAQSIWERALGADHPFVARALTGRAELLAEAGDVGGAKRLLERALEIRIRTFGQGHYLVARSLADLARLTAVAGDRPAAETLYLRALAIQEAALGPVHPELAGTLADLARLRLAMGKAGPALDGALRAEATARDYFRRSAAGLEDGVALRYEARRTSGRDVALSVLAAGSSGAGGDVPGSAVSRAAVRSIAEELIRSRAVVLNGTARRQRPAAEPSVRDVIGALPEGSAMVAYVRYHSVGAMDEPPAPAYLALVLRPGEEKPVVVSLGAAGEIDARIASWREEVSSDPRLRPRGVGERTYRDAGARLRESIWDPLKTALQGSRLVFVVPDGEINLVSLATLPAGDDGYLAETGPLIHLLSAERDLLLHRASRATGEGVLVVGGPDFDAKPRIVASRPAAGPAGDVPVEEAPSGEAPLCPEFAALGFEPLRGARAEAEEVEALWTRTADVTRLIGDQADEAAFKSRAPGRRILHIATHAYFLPDRCGAARELQERSDTASPIGDRLLLRSGLALAGANRRSGPGEAAAGPNGILTGEEIASLDLTGVEWAVLSGCETGVGKVLDGEGVVGLRRAFELAGVGTSIMSLWAVDDGAARIWMRGLYASRLSGLSTAEAVHGASLGILQAQREQGRTTHPYFWGGFVAAGDWR